MGLPGPGEITQIAFGGTTVAAQFIEGYSLETTADSYTSALGFDVERGSVTKQLTCNVLEYSKYSALNTLMKNRTKSTVTVTYVDAGTNALSNCIIRVTPLVHQVSDACQVFIGAAGADKTGLDAAYGGTTGVWTDLGVTIGTPAPTFEFAFDGVDGCGLPYYSSVRVMHEMILPGNVYSLITEGTAADVAIRMPDGNWLCFDDVYPFKKYANEDGSQPLAVRLHIKAVADDWDDIISYHDGSAGAATPGDYFAGCAVEATGFAYSEGSLVILG